MIFSGDLRPNHQGQSLKYACHRWNALIFMSPLNIVGRRVITFEPYQIFLENRCQLVNYEPNNQCPRQRKKSECRMASFRDE
jgi:hypothetical protein